MASLFVRGNKLYAKLKALDGAWKQIATGFGVDQYDEAARWVDDKEREVEQERADALLGKKSEGRESLTVRKWSERWVEARRRLDLDWGNDRGRLDTHVLPVIGSMLVADVRTRHIIELFERIRTTPREGKAEPVSQRTLYNIYSVVAALFRDAKLADLIEQSPCCLTERQLGPKRDKDPEWRAGAVFTRDEAQTLISTDKIPCDRRVEYAIELLTGLRPGETAAVRWRHYDAAKKPLGELLVAHSYSAKRGKLKGTKTDSVKHVPVHPTLAAILAEWKLSGWAELMGRAPGPDDLIVPLPPADSAKRTRRRDAEPFRTYWYTGRRWTEADLPALGWRHRRHYDMRATYITLSLEDGADPHIIETRVTHTKKSRSAFDGYNRGLQWERTCTEVAKLNIRRVPSEARDVIALPLARLVGATASILDESTAEPWCSRGAVASKRSDFRRAAVREAGLEGSTPDTRNHPERTISDGCSGPSAPSSTEPHGAAPNDGADHIASLIAAALASWRTSADRPALRAALAGVLAELEAESEP